jgi:hypothetical protein
MYMYICITSLILKETKHKLSIWEYFCIFISLFCVIFEVVGVFWYFSHFLYFLCLKLMERAWHVPASEWRLHHSDSTCDATRWTQLAFHRIFRYAVVSSSICNGAWQLTVVELSSVVVSFFFLLFSLLTDNVHHCLLCFYFSISALILLVSYSIHFSFIEVFVLFNLVLQLQFLICLVFHFGPHFLKFVILSLALLLKFFFFQFHPSIKFSVILFFSIWPLFFWFFFLLLKLFFNSIKPSNWEFLSL